MQYLEKVFFRRIGEDGGSTFASRMTEGRFIGYHDRTGTVLAMTAEGVCRGKSLTRQTVQDAWEPIDFTKLYGLPWHLVKKETALPKPITADKEAAGPPLPPRKFERSPEEMDVEGESKEDTEE